MGSSYRGSSFGTTAKLEILLTFYLYFWDIFLQVSSSQQNCNLICVGRSLWEKKIFAVSVSKYLSEAR